MDYNFGQRNIQPFPRNQPNTSTRQMSATAFLRCSHASRIDGASSARKKKNIFGIFQSYIARSKPVTREPMKRPDVAALFERAPARSLYVVRGCHAGQSLRLRQLHLLTAYFSTLSSNRAVTLAVLRSSPPSTA